MKRQGKTKRVSSILCLIGAAYFSAPSYAQSQDECAIWLCLPAGFPSPTCDASFEAMKTRISEGKTVAPTYRQCSLPSTSSPQNIWGHQISYEPCRDGYVPAAPGEDMHDVRLRPNLVSAHRQGGDNSRCLNTTTENTYTPTTIHTITLQIGTKKYPYVLPIKGNSPPRVRRGGAGNVR